MASVPSGLELYEMYQRARALVWRNNLDQFEEQALLAVLATMDAGRLAIMREVVSSFEGVSSVSLQSIRLKEALAKLDEITAEFRAELVKQYEALAKAVIDPAMSEAANAMSANGLIDIQSPSLTSAQIDQAVSGDLVGGRSVEEWVTSSFDATVKNEVRQAFASNKASILEGKGIPKAVEAGLNQARREAQTLTSSVISAANDVGRKSVQEANLGQFEDWVWITAGDNHVCLRCLPLHGHEFAYDEGPPLPRHLHCRCQRMPIPADWHDLNVPYRKLHDEFDKWVVMGNENQDGKITLRGMNEEVIRVGWYKTPDAWLNDMNPQELASTSLGAKRIELLSEGKIIVRDLLNENFEPRTVQELEALIRERDS